MALSGLASEFARLSGDQYCAGLWKEDLVCSLLRRREGEDVLRNRTSVDDMPQKCRKDAPSWSWAGSWAGVHGSTTEWFHYGSRVMLGEDGEVIRTEKTLKRLARSQRSSMRRSICSVRIRLAKSGAVSSLSKLHSVPCRRFSLPNSKKKTTMTTGTESQRNLQMSSKQLCGNRLGQGMQNTPSDTSDPLDSTLAWYK